MSARAQRVADPAAGAGRVYRLHRGELTQLSGPSSPAWHAPVVARPRLAIFPRPSAHTQHTTRGANPSFLKER
jgi:hypothetical protein